MPVGDVLVGDTGGDIEHDDTALTLDVVTITEPCALFSSCIQRALVFTSKLFLASGIPGVETYLPIVCVKIDWMHFDTQRSFSQTSASWAA